MLQPSSSPLISVVLPVFNGVATLEQSIRSVLDQQCSNIELIAIDGGSTDGTLDILEKYTSSIKYMETGRDTGISNAFNRGIEQAKGDFIAVLNSDDYWEPGCLAAVLTAVKENPEADIYHGWLRYLDAQDQYVKKPYLPDMKKYMSVYHPTMFVSRQAYDSIGLYREDYKFAMDSEWCLRAMAKGLVFCEIPRVIANMRLKGLSDREYKSALNEYREAVVLHGVNNAAGAYAYYLLHLGVKTGLRFPLLKRIKKLIDRYFNQTVEQ